MRNLSSFLTPPRNTDKAPYTGCSVHENNNGQATFENPMYNTNTKAAEGKVVRFDPNLNTICTMVWCLSVSERQVEHTKVTSHGFFTQVHTDVYTSPFLTTHNKDTALFRNSKHIFSNTVMASDQRRNLFDYWETRSLISPWFCEEKCSFHSVSVSFWINEPRTYG